MTIRSLTAQCFEVAPEVKGLKKELRARDSVAVRWVLGVFLTVFFFMGIIVTPSYYVNAIEQSSVPELVKGIIGTIVVIGVTLYSLRLIDSNDTEANEERRVAQRNLRKLTRSARSLDEVPMLTREHAEYGLRLDEAMAGAYPAWTQVDAEIMRSMLLSDLNRGITILSLIEDRGMTNADDVIAALDEMGANSGKPLQGGWL